ncbi:hypothetical protein [Streptomyces buecherae]|uniref:Uncharacterized protein n=1 Tax=Streptomyces buecherae TaxID=2763006 RepID=A0A7H8N2E3_9ACTN|nr:hypothetical protein [Streptomyces buecherae]QKW48677.1 hypothetical protein HUT08_02970 [Streptomyces buecherae]
MPWVAVRVAAHARGAHRDVTDAAARAYGETGAVAARPTAEPADRRAAVRGTAATARAYRTAWAPGAASPAATGGVQVREGAAAGGWATARAVGRGRVEW